MEPLGSNKKASILQRLSRPVSAPVVDLFRIFTGLLVSVYYIRLFREYSTYTSEHGLLDHALHRELFWFSKLTLFFPGSPPIYKIGLLVVGFLCAVCLTVGWRPKVAAVLCWIISVSVHRWNFAVINLDDSAITLLLWWMMFLPIGHTFTLRTLRGESNWRTEVFQKVDGFFIRAYFANLFIYYLTAGLTKLDSELWRDGLALFVVLNLPLARTQGWWTVEDIPLTSIGNDFTLIMEPIFPFLVFLPKGHFLKYLGGVSWFVFHLAIPLSIGVPYANFGLIIALILVFHEELGDFLCRKAGSVQEFRQISWQPPRGTRSLAIVYLIILTLAMQKKVPILKECYEPAMACLYLGGVAQEYHVFDWIDRFNWTTQHTVTVQRPGGEPFEMDSARLFPQSVRGFIVQSYLLPMRWMRVPRPLTGEMRNGIIQRAVRRFYDLNREQLGESGKVIVMSRVGRLDKQDLGGEDLWETKLVEFDYTPDGVQITYPEIPEEQKL